MCQSCVATMFWKAAEILLITGTTSSPLVTGSVPPVTKQFCTSTTISTALAPGLILPAARLGSAVARPVSDKA